jgi:hypothetical protein
VKSNFSKQTNHLQSEFTIIRPKNYKKSLLCGLISQTSAEMPPKNGGVRKANLTSTAWYHSIYTASGLCIAQLVIVKWVHIAGDFWASRLIKLIVDGFL